MLAAVGNTTLLGLVLLSPFPCVQLSKSCPCAACSAPLHFFWLLAELWDGRAVAEGEESPSCRPSGLGFWSKKLAPAPRAAMEPTGVSPCPQGKRLLLPTPASGLQRLPWWDTARVLGEERVLSTTGSSGWGIRGWSCWCNPKGTHPGRWHPPWGAPGCWDPSRVPQGALLVPLPCCPHPHTEPQSSPRSVIGALQAQPRAPRPCSSLPMRHLA